MKETDYEKELDKILPRTTGRPKKSNKRMGRPKVPDSEKRKAICISLSPAMLAVLEKERIRCSDASMKREYSTSHVIEDLIRQVLLNDERATVASREVALAAELRYFYELGKDARSVWWKNMSGLPGEIDGVLEKLTKKFREYRKSQGIEERLYPPEFDDDPPAPEDDSGEYVL